MSRDVRERLSDATVVALCVDGGEWPRGLLSEYPIPDKWMGLVIAADGRRRYVPAGEDPRCERGQKLLLVRNSPVAVPVSVADATAADGHAVSAACDLLLRWEAREDDLAAMQRTLLGEGELSLDALAKAAVNAGSEAALRDYVRNNEAGVLVEDDQRGALLDHFREALKRFAFDCGCGLERVDGVQFESESYRRTVAVETETRRRVERLQAAEMVEQAQFAATKRRLDDLGDLLAKLESAAAGDDSTQWHQLLPALSPADRGKLLENLWRITPDRHAAEAIVVVAGRECIWLSVTEPELIARRVALGDELGGLRSVAFCESRNWLLVGAALGVWALDATSGEVAAKFIVPDVDMPRTGFNAAVVAGERLYATSSELGCQSWALDDPNDVRGHLVPEDGVPKRVRAVVAADGGGVYFAGDDCVYAIKPEAADVQVLGTAEDTIYSLAALGEKIYVGCGDGRVFRIDPRYPDDWWLVYRTNDAIETIQARRWTDLVELVVPAGSHGICGIYDEQQVTTQLLESPTAIRRAWACDDLVVGLNNLRDRLIVMNANLPARTGRQAHLARLTSQTIQDACIVTRDVAAGESADEGMQA